MKASDISDHDFVAAVDLVQRTKGYWASWYDLTEQTPDLGADYVPPFQYFPTKVVLAKAAKVIKRGLIDGCPCGCRGDYEVTAKGRDLLKGLS